MSGFGYNVLGFGANASSAASLPSDDQFNRVSFLSHFDGANNGVNNAFDDSSSSNHTITANGNATQGSFGPFARPDGEWGVSFDGSGDSVTTPENAATRIADSNFTFEAFIFPTAGDSNEDTIFTQGADGVYSPFNVFVKSNKITLYISTTGSSWNIANNQSSSNSVAINSWTHVALVRNGATIQLYINGVADNSYNVGTNTFFTPTQVTSVGARPAGDRPFKGNISNVRLVIGTAVYTSAFTPPTSKLTAVTNTKLLTCQSNRFVDNSATGLAVSITGNPAVTAFGAILTSAVYDAAVNGASAYMDGDGDYLQAANSADFDLGTGNFTWECYANIADITRTQWFFSVFTTSSGQNAWGLRLESNGTLNAYFSGDGGESPTAIGVAAASSGLTENGWHHIAVVKNGTGSNNIQIYVDGVSKVTGTFGAIFDTNLPFRVGRQGNDTYAQYFLGYISDVRIVKGTAVYTGNFTPPTAPLTAITNTKLLLNMADAQAIDSAAQSNMSLHGDANISTDQAKFGDTSFHLDGTGDFSAGSDTSVGHYGSGDFTAECWVYPTASPQQPIIMGQWNGSYSWAIQMSNDTSRNLRFLTSATGDTVSSTAVALNQWSHVALVRNGSAFAIYLNGTSVATASSSAALLASTDAFTIGNNAGGGQPYQGYIDEVRISKFARYTSNFTAPSEPFADKGQ